MNAGPAAVDPGLCGACRWARTVRSRRSLFHLCRRSRIDPRYPRYPPLPVRACAGFEPRGENPTPTTDEEDAR